MIWETGRSIDHGALCLQRILSTFCLSLCVDRPSIEERRYKLKMAKEEKMSSRIMLSVAWDYATRWDEVGGVLAFLWNIPERWLHRIAGKQDHGDCC